jgi:hypothetical protein
MSNQQAPFSIDELNGAWHELIDPYLMNNLILSKKVKGLESALADLKAKLRKAELALLAAEGKQVIDG